MKKVIRPAMLTSIGIPVLQTLLSINPLKLFSEDKIKFKCLSKIKGRRRYKSDLLKQEKFAKALKEKIDSFKLLKKLTINTVTGSMLLEYTCSEELIDEMMTALNEQSKKLSETKEQPQKKGQKNVQRISRGAIDATAEKGMGRGMTMKGGKVTSILPTLLSTFNLTGFSGIVATVCLAWGGYNLVRRKQIPLGPQLVWLGYKTIEGLTKK